MAKCNPKRDCLIIPFPKKCFDFCVEKILRVSRPVDKINILGMDEDLAQAIFRAYNYGAKPIISFDDLESSLNSFQIGQIRMIFHNLSQEQLDHFIPRLK
ncbi:MAG: hypothetical protein AAF348_19440 [Bacteroidota bacterium]